MHFPGLISTVAALLVLNRVSVEAADTLIDQLQSQALGALRNAQPGRPPSQCTLETASIRRDWYVGR